MRKPVGKINVDGIILHHLYTAYQSVFMPLWPITNHHTFTLSLCEPSSSCTSFTYSCILHNLFSNLCTSLMHYYSERVGEGLQDGNMHQEGSYRVHERYSTRRGKMKPKNVKLCMHDLERMNKGLCKVLDRSWKVPSCKY